MPRARNVKPGFFKNELLAECDPLARILFAGLWCEADRAGRLEDRPRRLKAEYLPYDSCDVAALLAQLTERGFIVRYVTDGRALIAIPMFTKHQNPHVREPASTIPAPDSTVLAQCQHRASTEPARLIPDSPSLIPDSSLSALRADVGGKRANPVPSAEIVTLYHEKLPMLPKVEKLTKARIGYIRQRWAEDLPTLEAWGNFFDDVSGSLFLTGRAPARDGKPPFRADLEWLTRPGNFAKIAEGKYHR